MESAEQQQQRHFEEVRAQLIEEISVATVRTIQSTRQLNANLVEAHQKSQRIAALSSAWTGLLSPEQ